MKIKVISPFQDIHTKEMRNVGFEMEVDEARGNDLLKRGLAEKLVEEVKETPVEKTEIEETEIPVEDKTNKKR